MQVSMSGKINSYSLLTGMETGKVTAEFRLKISPETENRTTM